MGPFLFFSKLFAFFASVDEYMSIPGMEKREVDRVHFSALLGSARILRKLLDISG